MPDNEQKGRGGEIIDARAEIIPPELELELEKAGVDVSDPDVSRTVSIMLSRAYYGPMMLPPAFVLEEYKKEFPEIVAKLIEWTEKQMAHRHVSENIIRDRSENRKDRAQIGAAVLAACGIVVAGIVSVYGNPFVAGVIAVVSVGGPVSATILASKLGNEKTGDDASDS